MKPCSAVKMAECFPELSVSYLNYIENKLGAKMIENYWIWLITRYLDLSVSGKYLICWTLKNDILLNFCPIIVNYCTIICISHSYQNMFVNKSCMTQTLRCQVVKGIHGNASTSKSKSLHVSSLSTTKSNNAFFSQHV